MCGRKGGVEEFPSVFSKSQKLRQKKTPANSSVQASSSARDTNTEATSGEEDRKRKVPKNNRFTVNDIPLSEYDTEATSSISASADGASVRLMRPRTQQALQNKTAPILVANSSIGVVREIATRCSPTQKYTIRSLSVDIRIDMSDLVEHTAFKSALQTAGLNFCTCHSSHTKQLKTQYHGCGWTKASIISMRYFISMRYYSSRRKAAQHQEAALQWPSSLSVVLCSRNNVALWASES